MHYQLCSILLGLGQHSSHMCSRWKITLRQFLTILPIDWKGFQGWSSLVHNMPLFKASEVLWNAERTNQSRPSVVAELTVRRNPYVNLFFRDSSLVMYRAEILLSSDSLLLDQSWQLWGRFAITDHHITGAMFWPSHLHMSPLLWINKQKKLYP